MGNDYNTQETNWHLLQNMGNKQAIIAINRQQTSNCYNVIRGQETGNHDNHEQHRGHCYNTWANTHL